MPQNAKKQNFREKQRFERNKAVERDLKEIEAEYLLPLMARTKHQQEQPLLSPNEAQPQQQRRPYHETIAHLATIGWCWCQLYECDRHSFASTSANAAIPSLMKATSMVREPVPLMDRCHLFRLPLFRQH
ncbi:hypothetical protein IV203_021535 [Nitzschia inconspicua]|uniref:Uncharacterized protein n=1 Tax=Nitzschia inconspicua TaxID=303405 RepID=A0A9K3KI18_9STRA|nr:hypothetical protein IV203_021535 [Nitzschia inconspicua]